MTTKLKLTNDNYRQFKCPPDKRKIEVADELVTGLYLEIRHTGKSTFWFRYTNPATGRLSHVKVGPGDALTLGQARAIAREKRATLALGGDPKGEQDAARDAPLFSAYMEETYLPWTEETTKASSSCKKEQHFRLHLKEAFKDRKLNAITKADVKKLQSKLHAKGLSNASVNRVITTLRHALGHGCDLDLIEKNPCQRIKMYREDNQMEYYLKGDDLKSLLTVLKTDKNRMICAIVLFLLSTGARLNEALKAEWKHIDIEQRVWKIPHENSKSGKVRSVPLNDSAIQVLQSLDTQDEYDHIFINSRTQLRYTNITKSWTRIRKAAGLPFLRLHDLRHSHASFLVNSGRTLYEVQKILGHSNQVTTQRYSHLSTKTLQDASNTAADVIEDAMREAS